MTYTYAQWMQDTKGSVGRTSGRGKELEAVDRKFKLYEEAPGFVRQKDLEAALKAWKESKGPGDEWKKSARNATRAVEQLSAMLGGVEEETAFNMGRPVDFQHESLVHSRLGVLYLFSKLSIQPGLFSLVIEGGLDIAGQSLDIASDSLKEASKSTKGVDTANKWVGRAATANSKLGIGSKLDDKLEKKIFKGAPVTVNAQQILNAPPPRKTFPDYIVTLKTELLKILDGMVQSIKDKLADKFGIIEDIGGLIPKVVMFIVNRVCDAAVIPLAGSAINLAQKVGGLVLKVQDKFQTWLDEKGVELNQGHPTSVVDAIKRAQTGALLGGIYDAIMAAAGVAIDATAWGGGAIFNLVKSGLELLIKFIYRLAEALRFNKFCRQAAEYYTAAIADLKAGQTSGPSAVGSLPRRPFDFARWYRSYALSVPLIAVLTLNSGICGDKMSYLTMFNDSGKITPEQFERGVTFLDNLKPWGAEYLKNSGFTITAAGDVLVDALANTFAKGELSELALKGTEDDRALGGAAAKMGGGPLQMRSGGFTNSRDLKKSNVRRGVERLFKGFVNG